MRHVIKALLIALLYVPFVATTARAQTHQLKSVIECTDPHMAHLVLYALKNSPQTAGMMLSTLDEKVKEKDHTPPLPCERTFFTGKIISLREKIEFVRESRTFRVGVFEAEGLSASQHYVVIWDVLAGFNI